MFGNQNRTLRQRNVLGEIRNPNNQKSLVEGAAKQQITTRSKKSISTTATTAKSSHVAAAVKKSIVSAPAPVPAPAPAAGRKTRSSTASSSSAADVAVAVADAPHKVKSASSNLPVAAKSTAAPAAGAGAALKRKSRTSQAAAAASATAVEKTESKPTTKPKPLTKRTIASDDTKKAFGDSAPVNVAVTNGRRVSRKNSREEGVEEERIVSKNHAAKKARTIPHDDLDKDDFADPMMVSEYVEEIFEYLRELEVECLPNPNYMDNQKELQWKMRGILVDWLIEVHSKFRLLPETLFLAVNIIDRFLSLRVVSLVKLQLVGVTALFIACKYEEVMSPSIESFLYMAEDGYTESEIIRAERYVLQVLKFNMQYPAPLSFLRRSSKADDYDIQTRTLAKYLMEITLLDHVFLVYPASCIAASAHYLARHMLDRGEWDKNLVYYSGYTAAKLSAPVAHMLTFLGKPSKFTAVWKKYAQRKYMKGAIFVDEWVKSRRGCGVHPVYEHSMNVEARAEWIREKQEGLQEESGACEEQESGEEEEDQEEDEEDEESSEC